MIVVIADDFTGAAEIGGIGIRHGLRVIIQTKTDELKPADLLIIVGHTRALNEIDACIKISQISEKLKELKPDFVFKKIDSVLRGHIVSELKYQMDVFDIKKALIIAGNPSLGRTIVDGKYAINGVLLNETGFVKDSRFPAKSADVLEILDADGKYGVVNLKPGDSIGQGISIGDVATSDDLKIWAEGGLKDDVVYAGASGFFDALLSAMNFDIIRKNSAFPFGNRTLFVQGTSFPKESTFQQKLRAQGVYFTNMPREIYDCADFDTKVIDAWADEIVNAFGFQNVYITMNHHGNDEKDLSLRLCKNMGELVSKVADRIELDELLIEGGDTAATVLEMLKIRKLKPVHEYQTGVIRMEVMGNRNFYVTTKPGSYNWNEEILVARTVSV